MNPFHFAISAINVIAALDKPGPPRQKPFAVLFHILAPMAVIVPLIMIVLGDSSGVGWINLLSKICAVLVIAGIALLVARRLGS